jgi:hypothetical protein
MEKEIDKTTEELYKATINYIKTNKGTVVVIGGIAIVDEGLGKYKYGLMIRIMGKKPIFKK